MNTSFRFQEKTEVIGKSSRFQAIGTNADLSLAFSTQGMDYAFSRSFKKPVLFRSTNGCEDWQQQQVGFVPGAFIAVEGNYALVASRLGGVGYSGNFFEGLQHTADGGNTWSAVLSGYVSSLSMCGQNAVVLIDGVAKKSTDSGATWSNLAVPTSETVFTSVATGGSSKILLTSGSGVWISNNLGDTWTRLKQTTLQYGGGAMGYKTNYDSAMVNRAGSLFAVRQLNNNAPFYQVLVSTNGSTFSETESTRLLGVVGDAAYAQDEQRDIVVSRTGGLSWQKIVDDGGRWSSPDGTWLSVFGDLSGLNLYCFRFDEYNNEIWNYETQPPTYAGSFVTAIGRIERLSYSTNYRLPNFGTTGQLSLPVYTTGDAVTSWSATGLPAWASLNSTTGTLSGDPKTSGTHNITVTATNSGGSLTLPLRIVVQPGLPALAAGQSFTSKVGVSFSSASLQLASDTYERSFTAFTPATIAGLSLSAAGVLSGTPTTVGSGSRTVTLNGASGSATGAFSLAVTQGTPQVKPSQSFNAVVGIAFTGTLLALDTANRQVSSWAATGLPSGLTLNASTGVISGTPVDGGPFSVAVTATGPGGTGSGTVLFSIGAGKPIVAPNQTLSGNVEAPFSATLQAQDVADRPVTTWAATNLPEWATLDATTGTISGTPTSRTTQQIVVRATNPAGTSDPVSVSLAIAGGNPIITGGIVLRATVGRYFQQNVTLNDRINRPAVSWSATGLPPGLTISAASGVISGTPTQAGTFNPSITAVGEYGSTRGNLSLICRSAPRFFGETGLILQSGTTSRAFASGLLLVQASYLIKKANEGAANEILSAGNELAVESKAIDGLYIYPEPELSDAEDGFSRIFVTAYGRWKTDPKVNSQLVDNVISVSYGDGIREYPSLLEAKTIVFIKPAAEPPPDNFGNLKFSAFYKKSTLLQSTVFGTKFILPVEESINLFDPVPFQPNAVERMSINYAQNITRFEIVNYGAWNEYTVTIQPQVLVSIFN